MPTTSLAERPARVTTDQTLKSDLEASLAARQVEAHLNSQRPDHMAHWRAMARPPQTALKQIKGGRLQGMTDVNPQWRYQAMTEQFGPIGVGWKYEIDRMWTEPGCDGEILAFVQVSVRVTLTHKGEEAWSDPIIGVGGNHLIVKETKGLRNNDECWKMALTDALSVALKMLGVAADIYAGLWDGSKYLAAPAVATPPPVTTAERRVSLPAGTYQILRVTPQTNGKVTWADIVRVSSEGVEDTVAAPGDPKAGLVALCEQLAQEAVPVEMTTKVNRNGKTVVEELMRWKPEAATVPAVVQADEPPF